MRISAKNKLITCGGIGVIVIAVITGGSRAHGQNATPLPTDIVARLQEAERRVDDLRIYSFQLNEDRLEPGATSWVRSKVELQGTAWLNGLRNGKERVNLSKSVLEWEDGSSPWLEESLDMGFDGQFGRIAHHAGGAAGHTAPDHTAEVLASKPALLTNRLYGYATGALFSTAYANVRDTSLSKAFAGAFEKPGHYNISQEEIGGIAAVKVAFGGGSGFSTSYFFDPSRGYSLLAHKTIGLNAAKQQETWDEDIITAISEAAPGIWYPIAATHEERTLGKTGWRTRWSYEAKRVVANDPAFADADFKVPFPAGYRVFDRIKGIDYTAGTPPQELQRSLDAAIEGAKRPADATPPAAITGIQDAQTSEHNWFVIGLAIACGMILAGMAVIVIWRRRSRVLPVVIFLAIPCTAISSRAEAALAVPTSGDPDQSECRASCSVNVGYSNNVSSPLPTFLKSRSDTPTG